MNNPAAVTVMHVLHYKRSFLTVHGVDNLFLLFFGTGHDGGGLRSCIGPSMVEIAFNQMVATGSSCPLQFWSFFGDFAPLPRKATTDDDRSTEAFPTTDKPACCLEGHLHHLSFQIAHRTFHALSQKHGHIMHLQLGLIRTIMITSVELAQEILYRQDTIFANMPSFFLTNKLFYGNLGIDFTPYGEHWKQARRICSLHLLNSRRVQSFGDIREDEVA
ncbi:hypothetical protein QJS10_CPB12g01021 [Acorus calamus]|uniref:Cytochrome P450 n=1 Tax=Acorus calamus TaxID=4465 RepID=A0AAV9DPG0_ACOCL|nr:hypothetical protein QJS10_CPB12g01021 [Acorus calamus]